MHKLVVALLASSALACAESQDGSTAPRMLDGAVQAPNGALDASTPLDASTDAGIDANMPPQLDAALDAALPGQDAALGTDAAADAEIDAGPPLPPLGDLDLHPEALAFYMIPDVEGAYTGNWDALGRTLDQLHALMPDAWVRWDNETGHNTNDVAQVRRVVELASAANIEMIATASACAGYNNMWANRYVTGDPNAIASHSILDIANGGFLDDAYALLLDYPNVRLIETINEPDGPGWFVTDPDDSAHFDTYMQNLYAAMGISASDQANAAHLVGPSVAFGGTGNIWNNWLARPELSNVSYHFYGEPARSGLIEVPGKTVYVTEYGFASTTISPALLLEDLWHIEREGKLSGSIAKIFYNQLLQNGTNPSAFSQRIENGRFAARGWLRGLAAWVALARISKRAYVEAEHPDFVAADDRRGRFGMLLWNTSAATTSGVTRSVSDVSPATGTPLYVLRVLWNDNSDVSTGVCSALGEQTALSVNLAGGTIDVTLNELGSREAIYVSTEPCTALAE